MSARSSVEPNCTREPSDWDYRLRTEDHTWIVIEAKKRQVELDARQVRLASDLPTASLAGSVGISSRTDDYLGRYNPDYGVVTNGRQIRVGFLGHRAKVAGRDLSDDYGVVFARRCPASDSSATSVEGVRGGYLHRVLGSCRTRACGEAGHEPIIGYDEASSHCHIRTARGYAALQVAVEQALAIHEDGIALAQMLRGELESRMEAGSARACAELLPRRAMMRRRVTNMIEGELRAGGRGA